MTTKRQIIERAYSAAGLASYAFDLSAEEINQARASLDAMALSWSIKGIRIGYNPEPDPDAEIGAPDWAEEALALNLALRLSGAIGKVVTGETRAAAREAYTAVLTASSGAVPKLARAVPRGQGNRIYGLNFETFIPDERLPLMTGKDGKLEIGE